MRCNKLQTCNVCEATFKMKKGCDLEKRCPACRFLKCGHIERMEHRLIEKSHFDLMERKINDLTGRVIELEKAK